MRSVNLFTAVILVIVATALGYFFGAGQLAPTTQKIAKETKEVASDVKFQIVTLGEQNGSGQVGIATLREDNGKVEVNLKFVGAPDNSTQPAHIHSGACPTPGTIIYPLTNVVEGGSETILDINWDTLQGQKPLAINVHESEAQMKNYVACGDL